jgi:hypothetical protein
MTRTIKAYALSPETQELIRALANKFDMYQAEVIEESVRLLDHALRSDRHVRE